MATQTDSAIQSRLAVPERSIVAAIDRWIYVIMAVWLIAIVLAGFVPDSFDRIAQIDQGERPPFTWQAHVHATMMGMWMLLLLTQTVLMATGQRTAHMRVGVAGMVLALLVLAAGFMLVPANLASRISFAQSAGADLQAELPRVVKNGLNIVLLQARAGICFLALVGIGLAMRKRDSAMHKRLMVLATITPIGAATSRIPMLYSTAPESPLSVLIWPVLCAAPIFVWDLYRLRRVHPAYWWFLGLSAVSAVPVWLGWNSPDWLKFSAELVLP